MFFINKQKPIVSTLDFSRLINEINNQQDYTFNNKKIIEKFKKVLFSGNKVVPQEIPFNLVTMNSKIKIQSKDTDNNFTFDLVYPKDEDIAKLKVSVFSSIGLAVFARKIGENITYKTGMGKYNLKIIDIPFQPEAHGLFDL